MRFGRRVILFAFPLVAGFIYLFAYRSGQVRVISVHEWILLLHCFVISPILFRLVPDSDESFNSIFPFVTSLSPFAAVCVLGSFWFSPGLVALLFTVPWLLLTAFVAFSGFARLARRTIRRAPFESDRMLVDAGCMYMIVGGAWLTSVRGGYDYGFGFLVATLTAIHFHYAGFSACMIGALSGRYLRRKGIRPPFFPIIASILLVGPALTGIGIATSRLVEVVSGCILALGLTGLALVIAFAVVPRVPASGNARWTRMLLLLSAGAVMVAMVLVVVYAIGRFTGYERVTISNMILSHGVLNSVFFSLSGSLGFSLLERGDRS